jgi:hypothetical protein
MSSIPARLAIRVRRRWPRCDAARCLEETEEPAEVIVVSVKPPTKNQQ